MHSSAQTAAGAEAAAVLPPGLRLGLVRISVTDLDRAIGFYQDAIGLRLHRRDENEAAMGAGDEDLVVLTEERAARRPRREAGLYHYCLLFPTREELARVATRLATTQATIQGASDHGTHEAIYLADVDGNGIELAADRPRDQWPDMRSQAGYAGGPKPLDLDALLATIAGEEPRRHVEAGLSIGHLHLQVGDIPQAVAFYRDVVGFELMVDLGSAAFLSVDGYHHRLGANIWGGKAVPPASPDAIGLRQWTLILPSADAVTAARRRLEAAGAPIEERAGGFLTRDPWAIPLAITA
ncbi:MAG TPA: VOC family protein [Solirubrobacteraceae bacterium]|nr:VOC family protein [Solirubrobacteraceae bacterium]